MFLQVMSAAYTEEQLDGGDSRVVLRLPAALAPVKVAVLPLVKKDGMPEVAQRIVDDLKYDYNVVYDEKDSVGKRYRRQDAIGTPFCVTVDGQTLEDGTVTVDELVFTAWHTPGHTPGSVVLLCENYLFVGDTVFQGSIGRTDLEGGDSRKMDESLRKFAALPVPAEAQVLPGHGDFSTFGQEAATNFYIKNALRNA